MSTHDTRTPLAAADVITRTRPLFTLAGTHDRFADVVGEGFLKLRMEVGEL